MSKKNYEKPSTKVVALQQRTMLLAGSLDALDNYSDGGNPFNSREMDEFSDFEDFSSFNEVSDFVESDI